MRPHVLLMFVHAGKGTAHDDVSEQVFRRRLPAEGLVLAVWLVVAASHAGRKREDGESEGWGASTLDMWGFMLNICITCVTDFCDCVSDQRVLYGFP